jgi:hypothetical protein
VVSSVVRTGRRWRRRVRRVGRPIEARLVVVRPQWARILPHTVKLRGAGPVTLVDARGVPGAEVADRLAAHPGRVVVLVDDPHLGPVRAAGLVYEYVPPVGVAGITLADQQGLVEARRPWWTMAYGIESEIKYDRLVPITSGDSASTGLR